MAERQGDGAEGGLGDLGSGEDGGWGFEQADEADLANRQASGAFGTGNPAFKGVNIGSAFEHGQHQTLETLTDHSLKIGVEIGCSVQGVDADENALSRAEPVPEQTVDPTAGSRAISRSDAVFQVENHGIGAGACDTACHCSLLGEEKTADGRSRRRAGC